VSRDPSRPPPIDRRTFLLVSVGAVAAAACGEGDPDPGAPAAGSGKPRFLVPAFPDGFSQATVLVSGSPQRLVFVVDDEIDTLRESAPASLVVRVTADEATIAEETVERRSDGIITPYYPLGITVERPGRYEASLPDHPDVAPVPFLVADPSEVALPPVGATLPVIDTPTVDIGLGVDPICTRAVPCPFHDRSFATVATNGRPTALLIATPGFCQTDICGPVVDLLIDEIDETGRTDVDAIHAEVYVDPSIFEAGAFPDLTPLVAALDLPFEPVLFVLDGTGTVVARLDTTFDRGELRDALALV